MSGWFGGGGGGNSSSSVVNNNTNILKNEIELNQRINSNLVNNLQNNITNNIKDVANITNDVGTSLRVLDFGMLIVTLSIIISLYFVLK